MKVGVTGTREGMTEKQFEEVVKFFETHHISELHHGDCAGVDAEVAEYATSLGIKTVCHPPISDYLRVFHNSTEFREKYGYLERDQHIVNETELLLVIPKQTTWQPNGGTWYTHDYAVKLESKILVIWPSEDK